jgi:hypothetical protein
MTARWTTYNNFAPFYISFDPKHAASSGGTAPPVKVDVMIHYTPQEGASVPLSEWQSLNVRCVRTPKLKQLPKRLVTSLTWASIGVYNCDNSTFNDIYLRRLTR